MRRWNSWIVVFGLSLLVGSHDAGAAGGRCTDTHCGFYCGTHGHPAAGYCNYTEDPTVGCIQLYGPDCASIANAYCCTKTVGAL